MQPKMFEPLVMRGLTLPNRIVISPMCQYSSDGEGSATDWHMIHWGQYMLANAGLFFIEATGVSPDGRISPLCLGLYSDENEKALAEVLSRVRKFSTTPVAVQLSHAGRKASQSAPWQGRNYLPPSEGGWEVAGPSPTSFADGWSVAREMTVADISQVIEDFASAAGRAVRAGADCIEIHSAHGYLLSSFLSPLSNKRSDSYGGSLENRQRLVIEVFEAVRTACPESMPVGVRLNGSDWIEGGVTEEEAADLAVQLARHGCDFIDVSSGGNAPAKIPVGPGYQLQFASVVRQRSGLPTIGVGLIRDPRHAESILATGQADMIAIGRGFLNDPRWVWHAAEAFDFPIEVAPQYAFGATSRYRPTPGR